MLQAPKALNLLALKTKKILSKIEINTYTSPEFIEIIALSTLFISIAQTESRYKEVTKQGRN